MDSERKGKSVNVKRAKVWLSYAVVAFLCLAVAYTSGAAWDSWKAIDADRVAESDYLKLKTKVFNAISDRREVKRFLYLNQTGPFSYDGPLRGAHLTDGVEARLFHQTVRRRYSSPITVTLVEVFHGMGNRLFRFTEINGRVSTQTIKRERKSTANPLRKLWM